MPKLKDQLLSCFSKNIDAFFSGEDLAEEYNVSRAAVWKAVKALQKEGYDIVSSSKGYCFTAKNDFLNEEVIRANAGNPSYPIHVFDEIDSTNNYAKILAAKNAPHGTLVVADHQTAGRGRQGHSFYSPKNVGLYFSLLIKPGNADRQMISRITPAAAVSAVEAIETITGIRPGIKWVNDLFIEKKKIAGILSEAVTDFETGKIDTVIIGIGINCKTMTFPDDIRNIATSLNANNLSRSALAGVLWERLLYWTDHLDNPALMDLYRKDSLVLGKEITYHQNNIPYTGIAREINDEGNILIEKKDHSTMLLQSGEISIKDW